jgi:hypothetical protein
LHVQRRAGFAAGIRRLFAGRRVGEFLGNSSVAADVYESHGHVGWLIRQRGKR